MARAEPPPNYIDFPRLSSNNDEQYSQLESLKASLEEERTQIISCAHPRLKHEISILDRILQVKTGKIRDRWTFGKSVADRKYESDVSAVYSQYGVRRKNEVERWLRYCAVEREKGHHAAGMQRRGKQLRSSRDASNKLPPNHLRHVIQPFEDIRFTQVMATREESMEDLASINTRLQNALPQVTKKNQYLARYYDNDGSSTNDTTMDEALSNEQIYSFNQKFYYFDACMEVGDIVGVYSTKGTDGSDREVFEYRNQKYRGEMVAAHGKDVVIAEPSGDIHKIYFASLKNEKIRLKKLS